jgi:hypothetical protein
VAFALGEDRDEHIGAGDLLAARRLHMDHRALDDALEAGRRLGVLVAVGDRFSSSVIDIVEHGLAQSGRDRRCRRASRRQRPDRRSNASRRCSSVAYSCCRSLAKASA